MQNSLVIVVLVCALAVSIDRVFAPAPDPVHPAAVHFRPDTDAAGQLDKLIANSIRRQREINDQLDKTMEMNRRVATELRNFRHTP